jgi:hypothetical protein
VNFIGPPTRTISAKLNVCKNCLALLRWKDYSPNASATIKNTIVGEFILSEFFEKYPKDLISNIPTHTVDTAPLNDYSEDWGLLAAKLKLQRGYTCESCGLKLIGTDKKFLHGHHKDGQKSNNNPSNIEILCLGCHAKEPMHSHMKNSLQYKEFTEKY